MRPFRPWKSIRWKMSILAAVVLGGVLLIFVYYLFFQLQNVLSHNLDAELKVKARALAQTIKAFQDTKSPGGDIHFAAIKILGFDIEPRTDEPLDLADRQWLRLIDRYDLHRDYVAVIGLDGKVLATNRELPGEVREEFRGMFTERPRIRPVWNTISRGDDDLRALQLMILARDEPHYLIQIATPRVTVGQFFQGRIWGIAVSIVIVIALFSLVGLLLANRILRPVRQIARTAEALTHEDLSRRIEVGETDREMRFLVNAFNKMTGRLDAAFKHLAGMTGRIAHELKTPLAVIKGEGQAALRRERRPEEYRAVIESGIAETDRMLRVIDDLLLDADIAYDRELFNPEPIELAGFLEDIYRKSQILAEPESIRMELRPPREKLVVNGDRTHLRRLFFNLIDNAIKAGPPGSTVTISARREGRGVLISVEDRGTGIAPEDLPGIFRRESASSGKPDGPDGYPRGSGLGLRLCRVIARAHRGELRVASRPGEGSVFSLYLPVERS